MKKLLITSGIVIGILAMAAPAFASTFEGSMHLDLATGIVGTVVAVVAPTANPAAGTYTTAQNVTLTASGSDSIHYSINTDLGIALTCSSGTKYTGPVTIDGSGLLRAFACY
ncbi:MAG: chitobiase/beta-hexosaminidase C-terminal domain-containing protein, partial [Minisyncoccota bacterium]